MLKKFILAIIVTSLCVAVIMAFGTVNISYAGNSNFNLSGFENGDGGNATTSIRDASGGILNIVRVACVGIALIMLTVLGAKYMLAAPNDRAEIKKHAVVYVAGAIVIFAASGILGLIRTFATQINE